MVVVIVAAQSWNTDAYCVLGPADDAVLAFGVVFKAEDQTGKCLRIHVWQLIGPNPFDDVASGGAQSTAFANLEIRLQRNGDGPF